MLRRHPGRRIPGKSSEDHSTIECSGCRKSAPHPSTRATLGRCSYYSFQGCGSRRCCGSGHVFERKPDATVDGICDGCLVLDAACGGSAALGPVLGSEVQRLPEMPKPRGLILSKPWEKPWKCSEPEVLRRSKVDSSAKMLNYSLLQPCPTYHLPSLGT